MKNPIHKLTNHTSYVYCLYILNDGRLVSGSDDKSIIIYNKNTYQPDLIIKEHNSYISYIIQLSSGELVTSSGDITIKIFIIKEVQYEVLQTLNYHTQYINKIIELKDKKLVSCSDDSSIIFYSKDNNEFTKDYQISTNGPCYSTIQIKGNEICYSDYQNNTIHFYDTLERKIKASISEISNYHSCRALFIMISKDF